MSPFIAIIGICMTAVASATAADPDGNHDVAPWQSNPAAVDMPESKPKIVEYGPPPGSAGPRGSSPAPLVRAVGATELAPDPPRVEQGAAGVLGVPARGSRVGEPGAGSVVPNVLRPAPHASRLTPDAPPSMLLGGHGDKGASGKTSPLSAMLTVGGGLSIVLGLFLVIAWAMRKAAPRGSMVLPREVFEILGRAPLGARQQVQLLRCGNKLLLVSIAAHGTETLTEVTDPLEVDRIAGICQRGNPKSSTAAFRQVFQQLVSKERGNGDSPHLCEAPSGPLGQMGTVPVSALEGTESEAPRRKRYRWEEKHA